MPGKFRKCKICKTRGEVATGITNGLDWVCGVEHLAELGLQRSQKQREQQQRAQARKVRELRRAQQQQVKAYNAETKRRKREAMTDRELEVIAQREVNTYVRTRDAGKPCISCGRPEWEIEAEQGWKPGGAWDAGHFRTVAAATHLRFHLWGIHRQCKACNSGSHHHAHKTETVARGYEQHLRQRIGDDRVEWLKNANYLRRFSREYYIRIAEIFRRKTKRLKQRRG